MDASDSNGGQAGLAITVNLTDRDEPIQVTACFARLRENPQNGKVDLVCSRLLPEDGDPSRGRTPSGAGNPGSVVIETGTRIGGRCRALRRVNQMDIVYTPLFYGSVVSHAGSKFQDQSAYDRPSSFSGATPA